MYAGYAGLCVVLYLSGVVFFFLCEVVSLFMANSKCVVTVPMMAMFLF